MELGWLSLDLGALDNAERFFERALRDAHIDPAPAARTRAGLAVLAMHRKQWQEAGELLRAALAAEPSNAEFLSEYGELLRQRALADESPVRRAELLRAARSYFSKSFQQAPEEPLNLVRYGRTFLVEGEDATRAEDVLVEANGLHPSSLEIHRALAAMYLASERPEDARRHLTIVAARTHDRDVARQATDALRQISPGTLAERRGPDHPINKGLDNFALLSDERALAAATDDRITWAWATATRPGAREEAIQAALERCNEVRVEGQRIESMCRVYAVGNDIVWKDDPLETVAAETPDAQAR
jgi:tetratricopeptide (TPR) repeat protein